jgi:hypothetical protein
MVLISVSMSTVSVVVGVFLNIRYTIPWWQLAVCSAEFVTTNTIVTTVVTAIINSMVAAVANDSIALGGSLDVTTVVSTIVTNGTDVVNAIVSKGVTAVASEIITSSILIVHQLQPIGAIGAIRHWPVGTDGPIGATVAIGATAIVFA